MGVRGGFQGKDISLKQRSERVDLFADVVNSFTNENRGSFERH